MWSLLVAIILLLFKGSAYTFSPAELDPQPDVVITLPPPFSDNLPLWMVS